MSLPRRAAMITAIATGLTMLAGPAASAGTTTSIEPMDNPIGMLRSPHPVGPSGIEPVDNPIIWL